MGTKIDLKGAREVEFSDGSDFAKKNKLAFSEVSAVQINSSQSGSNLYINIGTQHGH